MRNKLMMTLALAAALGLTACGVDTTPVPDPEPVDYVDEIDTFEEEIDEEYFEEDYSEDFEEDYEDASAEVAVTAEAGAEDDITPILGYWYADGVDYFMCIDEDGYYTLYEQVSNVSSDMIETGCVSTTVMDNTYGFVADGAEETVLYTLSDDGNELMGYSNIFSRDYTGSYVDPAVGVDPDDLMD